MINSKHVLLGLTLGLAAGSASGQPPITIEQNLPTAIVSYADLDLTSPSGVAVLNGRVRRAAESLCGNTGVVSLRERLDARTCVAFALNHARGQIETAIAEAGTQRYASRATITVAGR